MSISDAIQIVRGQNDAATRYLSKTTTPELKARFSPVIKTSLDKVDATRLWEDLITAYNQIPFVSKQNPNLAGYVTDKAISGLFVMIAKEELKIRQNPAARTTELLKKFLENESPPLFRVRDFYNKTRFFFIFVFFLTLIF